MSLAKIVIQTIQVLSIRLFNKLNIMVLLHDSDVNIFQYMVFQLYDIDDGKKHDFIKHNYEDRGIKEIDESSLL